MPAWSELKKDSLPSSVVAVIESALQRAESRGEKLEVQYERGVNGNSHLFRVGRDDKVSFTQGPDGSYIMELEGTAGRDNLNRYVERTVNDANLRQETRFVRDAAPQRGNVQVMGIGMGGAQEIETGRFVLKPDDVSRITTTTQTAVGRQLEATAARNAPKSPIAPEQVGSPAENLATSDSTRVDPEAGRTALQDKTLMVGYERQRAMLRVEGLDAAQIPNVLATLKDRGITARADGSSVSWPAMNTATDQLNPGAADLFQQVALTEGAATEVNMTLARGAAFDNGQYTWIDRGYKPGKDVLAAVVGQPLEDGFSTVQIPQAAGKAIQSAMPPAHRESLSIPSAPVQDTRTPAQQLQDAQRRAQQARQQSVTNPEQATPVQTNPQQQQQRQYIPTAEEIASQRSQARQQTGAVSLSEQSWRYSAVEPSGNRQLHINTTGMTREQRAAINFEIVKAGGYPNPDWQTANYISAPVDKMLGQIDPQYIQYSSEADVRDMSGRVEQHRKNLRFAADNHMPANERPRPGLLPAEEVLDARAKAAADALVEKVKQRGGLPDTGSDGANANPSFRPTQAQLKPSMDTDVPEIQAVDAQLVRPPIAAVPDAPEVETALPKPRYFKTAGTTVFEMEHTPENRAKLSEMGFEDVKVRRNPKNGELHYLISLDNQNNLKAYQEATEGQNTRAVEHFQRRGEAERPQIRERLEAERNTIAVQAELRRQAVELTSSRHVQAETHYQEARAGAQNAPGDERLAAVEGVAKSDMQRAAQLDLSAQQQLRRTEAQLDNLGKLNALAASTESHAEQRRATRVAVAEANVQTANDRMDRAQQNLEAVQATDGAKKEYAAAKDEHKQAAKELTTATKANDRAEGALAKAEERLTQHREKLGTNPALSQERVAAYQAMMDTKDATAMKQAATAYPEVAKFLQQEATLVDAQNKAQAQAEKTSAALAAADERFETATTKADKAQALAADPALAATRSLEVREQQLNDLEARMEAEATKVQEMRRDLTNSEAELEGIRRNTNDPNAANMIPQLEQEIATQKAEIQKAEAGMVQVSDVEQQRAALEEAKARVASQADASTPKSAAAPDAPARAPGAQADVSAPKTRTPTSTMTRGMSAFGLGSSGYQAYNAVQSGNTEAIAVFGTDFAVNATQEAGEFAAKHGDDIVKAADDYIPAVSKSASKMLGFAEAAGRLSGKAVPVLSLATGGYMVSQEEGWQNKAIRATAEVAGFAAATTIIAAGTVGTVVAAPAVVAAAAVGVTVSMAADAAIIMNDTRNIYAQEDQRFQAGKIDASVQKDGPALSNYKHLGGITGRLQNELRMLGGLSPEDMRSENMNTYKCLRLEDALDLKIAEQQRIADKNAPSWYHLSRSETYSEAKGELQILTAAREELKEYKEELTKHENGVRNTIESWFKVENGWNLTESDIEKAMDPSKTSVHTRKHFVEVLETAAKMNPAFTEKASFALAYAQKLDPSVQIADKVPEAPAPTPVALEAPFSAIADVQQPAPPAARPEIHAQVIGYSDGTPLPTQAPTVADTTPAPEQPAVSVQSTQPTAQVITSQSELLAQAAAAGAAIRGVGQMNASAEQFVEAAKKQNVDLAQAFDLNKDGNVTREEIKDSLTAAVSNGRGGVDKNFVAAHRRELDENHDKRVTRGEVDQFMAGAAADLLNALNKSGVVMHDGSVKAATSQVVTGNAPTQSAGRTV